MIRTFPKTRLIINSIERTIRMTTPMPFSILPINELGLDILPAIDGSVESRRITKMLPDIKPSHYILCLYPPMEIIIYMTCRQVSLMNHSPIGSQTFF